MCSDSEIFNFSATSFGIVILKEEPLEDVFATAMSFSDIKRVITVIS